MIIALGARALLGKDFGEQRVIDLAGSAQVEGYMQAYSALTEADIFPLLAGKNIGNGRASWQPASPHRCAR